MQPTTGTEYVYNAPLPPVGALRRRIRVELNRILEEIKRSSLDDDMTRDISFWAGEFLKALRLNDREELIADNFTSLLQELLKDPIYNCPMDVDAILGNDGITYSKKAYELWKLRVPAQYKNRSPFFPKEEVVFSYKMPHPIVEMAVEWLKSHLKMPSLEWINEEYLKERMTKIKEEALKDQHISEKMRAENDRLMDERVQEQRKRVFSPLKKLAEKVGEETEATRERVNNAQPSTAKEDVERLREQAQKLKEDIENLEEGTKKLQDDQDCNQKNIDIVKKESKELQTIANNCLKVIKNQKRKRLKGIIKAVVIAGGCYLGTWGLSALAGESIGVAPVKGGFKVFGGFKV